MVLFWVMIIAYLSNGIVLGDDMQTRKLRVRAVRYFLIDGILYGKSVHRPYLGCLGPRETQAIMAEVHEGDCSNHAGGQSLANKILTAGYFWPHMHSEAL